MIALKVTTVGASAGLILPKEALAKLRVRKGDMLFLTEAPDGSFRITPHDPAFAAQMQVAEDVMHEDRDILHQLAR
jgi:putative addiction module antidote